jgi:putative hydrolase of the HAD superfamily
VIRVVAFDFGGVVAEEGFREGLTAIAAKNGLDPGRFFEVARELIYETGYVTGRASESAYWDAVRRATGIRGDDAHLAEEIVSRFVLRPAMLDYVDRLRFRGLTALVLSDQTDWLDRVDARTRFSPRFDRVLNSFYLKKSKRDPTLFDDVAGLLGRQPAEIFFVDDDRENAARAAGRGWNAMAFEDVETFGRALARLVP